MFKSNKYLQFILIFSIFLSCHIPSVRDDAFETLPPSNATSLVSTGLDILFEKHLDNITGKNIALVTNHSGIDKNGVSNISRLLAADSIRLLKIFSPEHGFTGDIPAGEHIKDDSTFINLPPVLSLYGENRKPTYEMLRNIDLIIYDIQDVGARFYTYISTLGLVMEAAEDVKIPVIVLDRPNPISNKIDGPILYEDYKSFVGMYPIPIQYGMTIGELAKMIVGEKMIDLIPELTVIPMENYDQKSYFDNTNLPWVNPSPNIPDLETAIIYTGFCLFESTNLSEGRGTYTPFKQIGAPWINADSLVNLLNMQDLRGVIFSPIKFIPRSIPMMSKYPKYQDIECKGIEVKITDREKYNSILTGITTLWAINKLYPDSLQINESSIGRIWGSNNLLEQLQNGYTPIEIINSYRIELDNFKNIREKYLIYK